MGGFWNYLTANYEQIISLLGQHLYLSVISVLDRDYYWNSARYSNLKRAEARKTYYWNHERNSGST